MSATIDVDIGGTFTDCYVTYGATASGARHARPPTTCRWG